ncbi:MAG: LURP-one-related family protein [Erysipelotrichaceae bacterium]|nr:LURP-one-related family protein [Erysipelotrichaceae bacterium]
MGILKDIQSFHEAGEEAKDFNVEDFGEPAYSLYTALNLGDLHQRIDITDEQENVKYYTKSSIFALKGKTDIFDANDNVIAHLEKKPISLHEKHFITMADGRNFTLSNELFHVVKDITNIEGLGWQIQGDIVGLNFDLIDESGNPVAVIGKKLLSIRDKYCIDLYQPEQEQVVVAIVIQLEKMLEARRESESSSAISFGGSDD